MIHRDRSRSGRHGASIRDHQRRTHHSDPGFGCSDHGIRRVPLHGLRHTCVSLLLALGIHPRIVMEIVGHSAIEMIMNVYGHVNLSTQRSAPDHLDAQLTD
ncbi:MAG TPA: tyrosine-type recombinase/integrase [Pseudonocardia sp.]